MEYIPFVNGHTVLCNECHSNIINNNHEIISNHDHPHHISTTVSEDGIYELLEFLPKQEKEIYLEIKRLESSQKRILWSMIKKANKDHIVIIKNYNFDITVLVEKGFLLKNNLYESTTGEISMMVLPDSPYLMRALRGISYRYPDKKIY